MDNTPIKLETILEQAPNWTFAGDFTLLQWMNKISQDLETRANKSSEALSKLNNNVRSINIGLDNVANSLTTLQFGNQFVECRVQDDDETMSYEATHISEGSNETEEIPTSQEMLKTFLDNNLKILRNCHEKYSLDLDDSDDDDDEDGPKEKTCIYQPINPYNERPLPFIFGSKDWHAKWHVGLYENQQDNNYSGDEISETFSESSNSPTDDQESFESNTEWASSNSIDNDNYNANIEVRNASSLRGSQALYPGTPSIPVKDNKTPTAISESSSMSTPSSSSLAKNTKQIKKHSEIKTSRSQSVSSINSKTSAKHVSTSQVKTKEKSMPYRTPAPPFVDLFAEPPEDIESSASSISSHLNTKSSTVDYTAKQTQLVNKERPSIFKAQPSSYVDLFAEPPEDVPSTTSTISSTQNIKRKPVNLFDDDNDDIEDYLLPQQTKKQNIEIPKSSKEKEFYEDDLLPVHAKNDDFVKSKASEETSVKTQSLSKTLLKDKPLNVSITPKSLFDDDDDDNDDFLKAFVKKSSAKESTKTSLSKTLLFDNDLVTESSKNSSPQNVKEKQKDFLKTSKTTETKTNRVHLFDDLEDDDNLLFNASNKTKISEKTVKDSKEIETKQSSIEEEDKFDKRSTTIKKSVNLFDDLEEGCGKEDHNQKTEIGKVKVDSVSAKKKLNLFDDLEDDDDDFFAIKPKVVLNKISDSQETKSVLESTNIIKDKSSKNSLVEENTLSEYFIKPKEYVEDPTDLNKTKENENFKEVISEQQPNEQIFSVESLKAIGKLNESSKNLNELVTVAENPIEHEIFSKNKENSILPQKVSTNSNKATKEQENYPSSISNSENSTKSIRQENILDHTEKPKVLAPKPSNEPVTEHEFDNLATSIDSTSYNQELNYNKKSSDFLEKLENLPKSLLQSDENSGENPETSAIEIPSSSNEIESSSSTTKYDFNSVLFLDEPPEDDNEFFETLAKSPLAFNAKYSSIDLENDVYEPELPKVPVTNANIITTDIPDNKQTSLYTGLQLFSDIPPDDEDDIQHTPKESTQTKRLHSIFYDDFNETLMALNQNQQKIQSSQKIFQNETPSLKEKEKPLNKDVVDHKLPEIKPEIHHKLPELKPEEKPEVVLRKSDPKTSETSQKRPVSKLQMPNININVQALLPGANTTLRKDKEDSKKIGEKEPEMDTIFSPEKPKIEVVKTNKKESNMVTKKELVAVPRTAETEHILPSVTKTRVRAPATRRPSTRKARQDNYRKSLQEEEQHVSEAINQTQDYNSNKKKEKTVQKYSSNVGEFKEKPSLDLHKKQPVKHFDDKISKLDEPALIKVKNDSSTKIEAEKLRNNKAQSPKDSENVLVQKKDKTSTLIFDNGEDKDNLDLFKSFRGNSAEDNTEIQSDKQNSSKSSLQQVDKKLSSSLLFDDEEDDDNMDFFKQMKSSNTKKESTGGTQNKFQTNKEQPTEDNSLNQIKTKVYTKPTSSSQISEKEKEDNSLEPSEIVTQTSIPTKFEGGRSITPNLKQTEKKQDNVPKLEANKKPTELLTSSVSFQNYDTEDENLFGVSNTTKPNLTKPEISKQILTKSLENSKELGFLDKENNKKNYGKPSTTKFEVSLHPKKDLESIRNKELNLKAKAEFKSFLDNESDDDDEDFTVAGLQTTKSKITPTYTANPSKTSTQKLGSNKNTSATLFSDSDTDGEDLFAKISSSKSSNKPFNKTKDSNKIQQDSKMSKNKPQSSLFSDDSDGDDFLKISESSFKNVTSKSLTQEKKSKGVPQSNASLFSDIDSDEDDLFGGGASKSTRASSIPTVKTSATTQTVATITQTSETKTIADNPLADLL